MWENPLRVGGPVSLPEALELEARLVEPPIAADPREGPVNSL
jgi:hypothetical protein